MAEDSSVPPEHNVLLVELRYLRTRIDDGLADIREIKATLTGKDGMEARLAVLEAGEQAERRHFAMLWTAIVAALGTGLSACFDIFLRGR